MDEEGKGCEGSSAGFAPIVPGREPHEGKEASSGQENNHFPHKSTRHNVSTSLLIQTKCHTNAHTCYFKIFLRHVTQLKVHYEKFLLG